ncbi:TPA: hypothetical protein ACKPX2_000640 [Stenotrophomonas maltophilia]
MSNDNKTLADAQPGGRVRLGDQAERARFEAWLATQHDQGSEHVTATVSATDDRYQSPVTSSMWSAWQAANAAREGGRINGWRVIDGIRVYSAYAHASILDDQQYVRYEDYLAALSAQPSPGGQDALFAEELAELRRLVPSVNQKQALDAAITALAARQPVGEPVGYRWRHSANEAWQYSSVPCGWEYEPLYAASPAQAVDLGQFRPAVELMEWQERGHAHPDFPEGNPEKHAEALRLLALIDSQAVGK